MENKLTNGGKPHICHTIQVHNNDFNDGLTLCSRCNMAVDKEPVSEEKQDWEEEFEYTFKMWIDSAGLKTMVKSFISKLLAKESDESTKYWVPCVGCKDGHSSFWKTVVESDEWKLWEEEQKKRFHEPYDGCFDVDECRETGIISRDHWDEFISFIVSLIYENEQN